MPETVFASLWEEALDRAVLHDLASPAARRRLARGTCEAAFDCVSAAVGTDRAALLDDSAALIEAVILLWASMGIEPEEIWMELHKRERLGSLLHAMSAGGRPKRRITRPWRVDSTKLP